MVPPRYRCPMVDCEIVDAAAFEASTALGNDPSLIAVLRVGRWSVEKRPVYGLSLRGDEAVDEMLIRGSSRAGPAHGVGRRPPRVDQVATITSASRPSARPVEPWLLSHRELQTLRYFRKRHAVTFEPILAM